MPPGKLDLLLKTQSPVLGITFRPPCRISDIRSYSWPDPRSDRSGLRLQMNEGAPVLSPASGKITYLDNDRTAATYILEITHSSSVRTVIRGIKSPGIRPGSEVKVEQILGKCSRILDIQIYVRQSAGSAGPADRFIRDITGSAVWEAVFTPLPVIGKGGVDAITNK